MCIFAILDAHGTGKVKSSETHDYGVHQESVSFGGAMRI